MQLVASWRASQPAMEKLRKLVTASSPSTVDENLTSSRISSLQEVTTLASVEEKLCLSKETILAEDLYCPSGTSPSSAGLFFLGCRSRTGQ